MFNEHLNLIAMLELIMLMLLIWETLLGECLKCVKEPTNEVDKHAVAVVHINSLSKEVVIGHVPKFISLLLSLLGCTLSIEVTGKRVNRVTGYGLEIPANFHLCGPENAIVWIRSKITNIEKKLSQNVNRFSLKTKNLSYLINILACQL